MPMMKELKMDDWNRKRKMLLVKADESRDVDSISLTVQISIALMLHIVPYKDTFNSSWQ